MSLIAEKQLFYINSKDRQTGTTSDFTINLDFDKNKSFDKVCVLQCLIPQSYYLIQVGQNTFTLKELGVNITVTLPVGNYTRKSLSIIIGTTLTAASLNGWTYAVSYSQTGTQADTGLNTYIVSGNLGQPSLIFGNYCFDALGFNQNSTNVFVANSLISVNVIKLNPEDAIYLHSDLCSNHNDDVLQDIYTGGTGSFSANVFQNFDIESTSKNLLSSKNNVYRFYLTNENDQLLNLNGQNLVITLMLYKKNVIWAMLPEFLNYELFKK